MYVFAFDQWYVLEAVCEKPTLERKSCQQIYMFTQRFLRPNALCHFSFTLLKELANILGYTLFPLTGLGIEKLEFLLQSSEFLPIIKVFAFPLCNSDLSPRIQPPPLTLKLLGGRDLADPWPHL